MVGSPVLDPVRHSVLIRNIDEVCRTAHIPQWVLPHSMSPDCGAGEVEHVRKFRRVAKEDGLAGLVYVGKACASAHTRMLLIAGALIRNYVDARVLTVHEYLILDAVPEAVLVPDFFDGATSLPEWRRQELSSRLLDRYSRGLQTFLCCRGRQGLGALKSYYSEMLHDHVKTHYREISN